MSSSSSSSLFFEGVGNEVLIFSVLLAVGLPYLCYFLWKTFFSENSEDVTDAPENLQGRVRSTEHTCAICLCPAVLATETNCGHAYCGECIFRLYEHGRLQGQLSAPTCPYCRQRITMLLPYFSEEERNWAELEDVERRRNMEQKLAAFNRRFSNGTRSFAEHFRDLPALGRYLYHCLLSGQGLSFYFRIRLYFFLFILFCYVILPTDLIPEAVFGPIGLLDDAVFGVLLVFTMANYFRAQLGEGGEI